MKPFLHNRIMAKKFGGKPEDYDAINSFIDESKSVCADVRHRALLHSAWGCFMVEKVFGKTFINSDNKEVSTRDVAEEHILQDLGFIPSAQDYLQSMQILPWMSGTKKTTVTTYAQETETQPATKKEQRYVD